MTSATAAPACGCGEQQQQQYQAVDGISNMLLKQVSGSRCRSTLQGIVVSALTLVCCSCYMCSCD
jgi:mevalonate pyrophosphate decarboxylase